MSLMSLLNTPQIALPNRPNSLQAVGVIAGRVSAKCNRGTRSTADRKNRVGDRGRERSSMVNTVFPSPIPRYEGVRPLLVYTKVWKKMLARLPATARHVVRVATCPVYVAHGRTEGSP
jgi:hypothetical protein